MSTNKIAARFAATPIDDGVLDAMINEARIGIERDLNVYAPPEARVGVIASPVGQLLVAESDRGLAAIHYIAVDGAERTSRCCGGNSIWSRTRRTLAGSAPRSTDSSRATGPSPGASRGSDSDPERIPAPRADLASNRSAGSGDHLSGPGRGGGTSQQPARDRHHDGLEPGADFRSMPSRDSIRRLDRELRRRCGKKWKLLRAEGFNVGRDLRMPARAVMGHRQDADCSAGPNARPGKARGLIAEALFSPTRNPPLTRGSAPANYARPSAAMRA